MPSNRIYYTIGPYLVLERTLSAIGIESIASWWQGR